MNETNMIILVIGSSLLGRFGGMGLLPFKKGWRRYGIPLLYLAIGMMTFYPDTIPNELYLAVALTCGALHLGYGQSKPYWWKFIVSCLWVLPSLLLGFTIWQIILPILWILLFKFSNWGKLADEFSWGIVELIVFGCLGIIWYRILS